MIKWYLYSKYALNFLRMSPIKFLAIKVRTQDRITCIAFSFEFSFSVGASTSHPRLPFVLCCIFEPPASLQHRHPNLNPNRRRRSALTSWLPFELCLFCLGSTWVPLPLHPTPLHSLSPRISLAPLATNRRCWLALRQTQQIVFIAGQKHFQN